jgi:hypothetical protein
MLNLITGLVVVCGIGLANPVNASAPLGVDAANGVSTWRFIGNLGPFSGTVRRAVNSKHCCSIYAIVVVR